MTDTIFSRRESILRLRQALTDVETGQKAQLIPRDLRTALETLDEALKLLSRIHIGDPCRLTPDHSSRQYHKRWCLAHGMRADEGSCPEMAVKMFLEELEAPKEEK